MQEIELKFLIPEARLKGLMRQTKVKSSQTMQMQAHYYDTAKQELAERGIGLRIRKEGDDWIQTIKAGGDGMASRLEHNAVLDNEHVQAMLDDNALLPDLTLYEGTAIAPILADFELKKLAKNLTRQYIADVQRTTRVLEDKESDSSIEIAYDNGQIIHGSDDTQCQSVHEIEFELVSGDIDYLFATAKIWCKRYKLCLSTVTKAERGGLLLDGVEYSAAVSAKLKELNVNEDTSMPAFVRAVVHNCLLQILPNSSAIAAGSSNSAHVIQLRIGLRRLRIALKAYKKFSEQINPEWLSILKQTERLLGDYLEIGFLNSHIEPKLEQQGAPSVDWSPELAKLKVTPNDAIRANDFQLMLLELINFVMSEARLEPRADTPAIDKLSKRLAKQHAKLLKTEHKVTELGYAHDVTNLTGMKSKGDDATDASDASASYDAQHKLRCQIKDMRYLSEFAAPLYSKKKTKRNLKRLVKAQKSLERYLDNRHYQQQYQQKSLMDANALFGVGWFSATLIAQQKQLSKRLAKLSKSRTFW